MGLRLNLEALPETVSGFIAAANERFYEGISLANRRHFGAAVYLIGFSAEMLLKVAALRFDGAVTASPVTPRLNPVKSWMSRHAPGVQSQSFHSVLFWAEYLRLRRADRGSRLSRQNEGLLIHHTSRVYSSWWVGARYRGDIAVETDYLRLLGDVTWIRTNFTSLWKP